jgi:hypothetical protein
MPEELGIPEIIPLGDSWNKCPQRELFLRMARSKSVPWHNVQQQKKNYLFFPMILVGIWQVPMHSLCITRNE